MHDFIQSLAFNGSQPSFAPVARPAEVPIREIMRSFDAVPATCRPSRSPSGRGNQKSRIKTRK
jgi:hypothetical protein